MAMREFLMSTAATACIVGPLGAGVAGAVVNGEAEDVHRDRAAAADAQMVAKSPELRVIRGQEEAVRVKYDSVEWANANDPEFVQREKFGVELTNLEAKEQTIVYKIDGGKLIAQKNAEKKAAQDHNRLGADSILLAIVGPIAGTVPAIFISDAK